MFRLGFRILAWLTTVMDLVFRPLRALAARIRAYRFRTCGASCVVRAGDFTYDTISLGKNVYIGPGATIRSSNASIRIGDHALFGPNVMIIGGDHRFEVLGRYMAKVHDKDSSTDQDVSIESDVWIGAGALILKGVTVGRGSIVGAGSVVTRSIPPYSIYTGSPPRLLRPRWSAEQIEEHERILRERNPETINDRAVIRGT